jgi:uncharacterized protein YjiS (DUF1127 family)
MATSGYFTTEPASVGARFRQIVEGRLAAIARVWQAARNRRRVAKLLDWDDHMLGDIGLTKGDVYSAMVAPLGEDPSRRLSVLSVERRAAIRAEARERLAIAKRPSPARRNRVVAKSDRLSIVASPAVDL